MSLLILNAGSSTLKYQLFGEGDDAPWCRGLAEPVGSGDCTLRHWTQGGETRIPCPAGDHATLVAALSRLLAHQPGGPAPLAAIGHRVVHGGERYRCATRVDARVEADIEALAPLAPLHNPASLAVIRRCRELFPEVPQVAVFDTAFHLSLPERAWRYAVPQSLYRDHGVRRHGFHGISHGFVARRAAQHLGRPDLKLISLHLGNGASAAAIDSGRCVDTSMGLSPLEGLVMGTRPGDLDPALVFHLVRRGLSLDALETLLTEDSGLKGLCGSADMREVLARVAAGDAAAALALDIYGYRIRQYIGAYATTLGGLDALVFTAGVGENAPQVRELACQGLGFLGIHLDRARNLAAQDGGISAIHGDQSRVAVLVVPTDEEREIARQVRKLIDPFT